MPRKSKSKTPNSRYRDDRELIRPPSSHAGWMSCIIHLHRELARLGLRESDLAPYQTAVFREGQLGLNEQALTSLFDCYHTERLFERRAGGAGRPAKPRIELGMFFTSKGNFAVDWRPAGHLGRIAIGSAGIASTATLTGPVTSSSSLGPWGTSYRLSHWPMRPKPK